MKTADDIEADLRRLAESHYYSEDYELEWAGKTYFDQLTKPEQDVFEQVMIRRLSGQPDLSDVALCTRLGLPSLTPYFARLLDRETMSTAMSRALLVALSNQPDRAAYGSVERFMESEQEGEALACLSRMHFARSMGHLRRAIQREHLHNFCLHILHEHMRHVGMELFLKALHQLIEPDAATLRLHLLKILTSKEGSFNPFTAEELETIMAEVL